MAREFSKKFYNSKQWKECRASYISYRQSIDGGLCETCGHATGNLGWIVHHKVWIDESNINNPEVTLNQDNLKYDCQICHNQEKEGQEQEQPRYIFGLNGEVILIKPECED